MYRGREGQWAFLLHRLSGLAILAYLMMHVFSIGSFILGEKFYMRIHHVYDLWLFRVALILVATGVVYHALNGLRIIVMDFAGMGVKYQRGMFWAVFVLTGAAFLYTVAVMWPRIQGGF